MAKLLGYHELEVAGSPSALHRFQCSFNHPQRIITLHPFTITNVNLTPAISNIGGRACVSLAGAGAATDGHNAMTGVAGNRLMLGKQTRMHFGVRSADETNHEWWFGMGTVSTTGMANLSGGTMFADFIGVAKIKTETSPRVRYRKASGTEGNVASSLVYAAATWYDFELVVTMDGVTAGKGRLELFSRAAGAAPQRIYDAQIGLGLPDTVSMAMGYGFLEGDTGTDATGVSHYFFEQEY